MLGTRITRRQRCSVKIANATQIIAAGCLRSLSQRYIQLTSLRAYISIHRISQTGNRHLCVRPLYCLSWMGTSLPVACDVSERSLTVTTSRAHLLEKTSDAVRDLLGGTGGLLVAGLAEDAVDTLVCGQWDGPMGCTHVARNAALTKGVLLAGGLLGAAGGDGVGSALGGGFSGGRHVCMSELVVDGWWVSG